MTLARAFRRATLPLGSYYAVTLALPLANGAAQSGSAFVNHALVVMALPPLLIVLAWAVHRAARVLAGVGRSAFLEAGTDSWQRHPRGLTCPPELQRRWKPPRYSTAETKVFVAQVRLNSP